ncbi:MAG TPA: DUF4342 domain-containing protein [Bacillota bacterium]|nr:DUF4342 domain-containing protein [Bacillota bacterium]HOK69916.1 DUF4342 domain-containing protein [Bacillota bacterium]HOL52359.1 DUF4342 domain-containing protein [Bacillota bacterium]HOO30724.1 DUF4342 domain-containing protein [Bacillota bacterium]HPQ01703.1 DUF4342 domain-containing protein [Bacillota bacterium]
MKVDLDKIDKLRARIDLGYDEAAAYLEAAGGDLVQALIMAERDIGSAVDGSLDLDGGQRESTDGSTWTGRLADVLRRGSEMRLVVERDGANVAYMPVSAGLVGAIFAPELAAVGAILALATRCTMRVEPNPNE